HKNGYLYVSLGRKKIISIHRLVAEVFIPNPNNLPQINHKDEDKTNNRVENIEWCNCKYNINDGTHNKRVSDTQINDQNKSKKVIQFTLDG
ncbi:endonuclease, partial [Klebsiella pneumoniae]|nr:endonuclease [Klebsiella pneumoniae]